jgi:suppressor of fused-like protein
MAKNKPPVEDAPEATPGWDAIDAALEKIYRKTEPLHYASAVKWMMGGPDPLDGVSVYQRDLPSPHWHFVSYGLTELYVKESDDAQASGFGFELTFRLARDAKAGQPPMWAIAFLQNLARYVFESGNPFAPGHHLNANGPIAQGEATELRAVLFAADPELPELQTPHGSMQFVQIVGITLDELDAVQAWNSTGFTALLAARSPLLVTDLTRKSILLDAATAKAVREQTEKEGSSTGEIYVGEWKWRKRSHGTRIVMGAQSAQLWLAQLRGRLVHGRPLVVLGAGDKPEHATMFVPGEKNEISLDEDGALLISLTAEAAQALLESVQPTRGIYKPTVLSDLEIEVVATSIKDQKGNVVKVIG